MMKCRTLLSSKNVDAALRHTLTLLTLMLSA